MIIMKNKRKYKLEIVVALIYLLMGAISLILPFFGVNNCKAVLIITFGLISIVSLLLFIFKPKDKDLESLYTFLASFILLLLAIILKQSPLNLALMLLLYVMFLALIRLKKADFYHDRRNAMWQINIVTLGILVLVGLVTSINLYYQSEVQILMFGYFFLVNGILELIDPLVLFLKG